MAYQQEGVFKKQTSTLKEKEEGVLHYVSFSKYFGYIRTANGFIKVNLREFSEIKEEPEIGLILSFRRNTSQCGEPRATDLSIHGRGVNNVSYIFQASAHSLVF